MRGARVLQAVPWSRVRGTEGGTVERQVPSMRDPLLKRGPQRALIDVDGCHPSVRSSPMPGRAALNPCPCQSRSSSPSRARAGWDSAQSTVALRKTAEEWRKLDHSLRVCSTLCAGAVHWSPAGHKLLSSCPPRCPKAWTGYQSLVFFYRGLRSSSQPQKQNEDEVPRGSSGLSLCPRLNLLGLSGVRREIIPLSVLWALSVKDHRELLRTGLTSWNPLGILQHP